jgi:single-strand DNA-binding protein
LEFSSGLSTKSGNRKRPKRPGVLRMAGSVNSVMLLGRVTRDIEIKYLQSGTAVANVGFVVDHSYKGQDGQWIEKPVWVDVTMWGRTAEIAGEYLAKGRQAHIQGRLDLDQWEKDGKKFSKLKVVCEKLTLVGGRGDGGGGGGGSRNEYSEPIAPGEQSGGGQQQAAATEDDVPF